MLEQIFSSELKTLGLLSLSQENLQKANSEAYSSYIKVVLLTTGFELQVDLKHYSVKQPSLFFISPNQYMEIKNAGIEEGYLIFYNRDFYCIQIHDEEVACDGLLFNNVPNIPAVTLDENDAPFFTSVFRQMTDEFSLEDVSREEMIRTYLKQIFIKAARLWKKQNLNKELEQSNNDLEFFRKFTMLIEEHYKQKHNVSEYAALLYMAPKTITHKFKRLNLPQPNDVIKNRIVLEAKRLLAHTSLTSKEIAYRLGYEDPAYFSRIFAQKTGETPSGFREKFLSEN